MSDKYEDLAGNISEDTNSYNPAIKRVLRWLDEHPDQAPGRTITEGQLVTLYDWARNYASDGWRGREVLSEIGITVVPDPEPTNTEKLKAVLDAIGDSTAGYREHLASKLDEAGVKAPCGDDD